MEYWDSRAFRSLRFLLTHQKYLVAVSHVDVENVHTHTHTHVNPLFWPQASRQSSSCYLQCAQARSRGQLDPQILAKASLFHGDVGTKPKRVKLGRQLSQARVVSGLRPMPVSVEQEGCLLYLRMGSQSKGAGVLSPRLHPRLPDSRGGRLGKSGDWIYSARKPKRNCSALAKL